MKRFLAFLLVSSLSFILLVACDNNSKDVTINDLAPQFELEDLDGNIVSMKDLQGEKVYIKYWASWCSVCLAGLEELNELSSEDHNFRVISIVSPRFKGEMSSEKFKTWFESLPADQITVLLDEKGVWAREFGVLAYPTSYYIGSHGELEKTVVSHHSNEDIINLMDEIK